MLSLANSFDQIYAGVIGGSKCKIDDTSVVISDTGNLPMLLLREVPDCMVLDPQSKVVNLFINNACWCFRWVDVAQQWQDLTSLFAEYGKWNIDYDINRIVDTFGLLEGVCIDIRVTDDYTIGLEKANNLLFIHTEIRKWGRSVKQRLFSDINELQQIVAADTYIYSIKPNIEYRLSTDTTFKFAEMVGYRFFERATLADGFDHDIYKRERTTIL